MGYNYFCLLTLEDIKTTDLPKDFEEKVVPRFVQEWNKIREERDKEIEQLKSKRDSEVEKEYRFFNLPTLGESTRDWWSYGPTPEGLEEVKKFTTKFSKYTFGLHCFYFDFNHLESNYLKGDKIIETIRKDPPKILLGGRNTMKFEFCLDTLSLERNITIFFNREYYSDFEI